MKLSYYSLFILSTSLAMAANVVTYDPFEVDTKEIIQKEIVQKEPIPQEYLGNTSAENENQVFDNDNTHVYTTETSEIEESPYIASKEEVVKVVKNAPQKVVGTRTQDAMLAINGDIVKVNSNIFSDALCRDCLQLTEYLYFGTKRYEWDKPVYPGAFERKTNLPRPPLYETLKKKNIKIFSSFFGTNGGKEGSDIGMLAYRRTPGHLELFVVFEGSQGEVFEFLGGYGGASWRTNFQADKVEIEATTLNLAETYGKLSFHEGYYTKIFTSKIYFERELRKLFSKLKIKEFSEYNTPKSDTVTQQDIDTWRGYTVDVYIFGHSQGGGLTQIGAPYVTATVGRMLYGDAFDNKTFNVCHAICLSPARAIGDKHTLDTVLDVMGNENIFGWCSPIDVVAALPLGHNADKRSIAKWGVNALKKIGKGIFKLFSRKLSKELKELGEIAFSVKHGYETLPTFAYVDHVNLLEKYCETGIKVYSDYSKILERGEAVGDKEEAKKQIAYFNELKKQIPEIKELVYSMQKNYFKAHTSNLITSWYYTKGAVNDLRSLLNILPVGDMIGSQHWGAPVLLKNSNSSAKVWVETLFHSDLLSSNVQENLDRGVEYEKRKNYIIEN